MARRLKSASFVALLMAMVGGSGARAGDLPPSFAGSEATVGQVVGNYRLVDQEWNVTPFHSLRGKAVLLTFFYADCHGPCFLINDSMRQVYEKLDPDIVEQVMRVSITIDVENDTPGALRTYGAEFTDSFDTWRFLSADKETLAAITADLGFAYSKTPLGFDHLNRLTLLGPDGAVRAHFYGVDYDPAEVNKAVRDTLEGRPLSAHISDTAAKLLLYCSNYDPITKTYRLNGLFVATVLIQYLLVMATLCYIGRHRLASWSRRLFRRTNSPISVA